MKSFQDKVVLITGGSSGIGRATAIAFDQPSSALAVFQNEAISKVAREFDLMFGRLLQSLGCVVPDALCQPAN